MTQITKRNTAACAAGLVLGMAACGGITRFEDTTPIVLNKPAPPVVAEVMPRVEVQQDRIVIKEKIQFAFNAAEILPASDGVLGEVASAIKDHGEIKKVGIYGHTDSDGESGYNQDLSQRRAAAVVAWLKAHGVDAKRLQAKGFGESQPVADNATNDGKERNRRVEFLILEQEGAK